MTQKPPGCPKWLCQHSGWRWSATGHSPVPALQFASTVCEHPCPLFAQTPPRVKGKQDPRFFWKYLLPISSWNCRARHLPVLSQSPDSSHISSMVAVSIFSSLRDCQGGKTLFFSTFLGSVAGALQTDKRDSQEKKRLISYAYGVPDRNEMKISRQQSELIYHFHGEMTRQRKRNLSFKGQ